MSAGNDIIVTGGTENITLRPREDGKITIQWGCTARRFTTDDLRDAIDWAESFSAKDGIWVRSKDSDAILYGVRVEDEVLYATKGDVELRNEHVPWPEFRAKLFEAIAAVETPEAEPATPEAE